MLRRIGAQAPEAEALTRALTVLGDGAAPDAVAALARLDAGAATRVAVALAAADVLADGVPLRFRHPVVRAAVAEGIPAVELAALHGRAARLLAGAGAPPAAVAAHLLAAPAGGDDRVVRWLRGAAAEARAQGSPEAAAADLARALAEPPTAGDRAAVLRELGSAEVAAALAGGPGHLEAALELLADPRERASVALDLGGALSDRMQGGEAAVVARRALAELGGADRELTLELEVLLAQCVRMDPAVAGDEHDRLRRRAAELIGDTPAEKLLLAAVASMSGSDTAAAHADAAEQLERALASGARAFGRPETGIVSSLIRAGRLEVAERHLEGRIAEARAGGLVPQYAAMTGMRGWIALERGTLAEAEADLRAAVELGGELARPVAAMAGMLAHTRGEQGRLDEADDLLAEHGIAGELPEHQVMNPTLFHRGQLRLLQGRPDDALADLMELGRRYERLGIRRAVPPWRSSAAVLRHRRGETEPALALAEEELVLARRWGTPVAVGVAERAVGLLTSDPERLATAVRALGTSPARLELARAQVELGALLRRSGRRAGAREPLRLGMDGAHMCGAAPLAEHAREELRATGARPRRLALSGAESLTAGERRVARLAAQGLTNRRIAQELFVTTATVETHLRHVFQKLDIGSRGELADALGAPGPPD